MNSIDTYEGSPPKGVVVASKKASLARIEVAKEYAHFLGWNFECYSGSIKKARERNQVSFSLVVTGDKTKLTWDDGAFEYHPGMAIYRIGNARPSPFIAALRPAWGDRALDTTLGFGRDAMQVADRTGTRVVGFERNPVMALLTQLGLAKLGEKRRFKKVCPRISIRRGDGFAHMRECRDNQYDLVLLDPMFPKPVDGARDMEVLHKLVDIEPFHNEVLREAARVGRKRAVLRWPVDKPLPDFSFRNITRSKKGRFLHLAVDCYGH